MIDQTIILSAFKTCCFRSACFFGLFLAGFGLFWAIFGRWGGVGGSFGRTSWGFVNRPDNPLSYIEPHSADSEIGM